MEGNLWIWMVVVDAFVALTAIGGGIALATGLEGERFPKEWLEGTPFTTYVIPGLILAIVVGGSATVAVFLTVVSQHAGGAASIVAGAAMVGFIVVELIILNDDERWTWTEVVYIIAGLLMLGLGLQVWLG